VFSFLFTPLGRYFAIAVFVLVTLTSLYVKIREDAVAEVQARATADAMKRTQDAVRAGDAVDVTPDRLRDPDGHNRD
jgi:high-affinity K+ transport system ATPase subunit B